MRNDRQLESCGLSRRGVRADRGPGRDIRTSVSIVEHLRRIGQRRAANPGVIFLLLPIGSLLAMPRIDAFLKFDASDTGAAIICDMRSAPGDCLAL